MFTEQNKPSSGCSVCDSKIIYWLGVVLMVLLIVAGIFLIRNWYKSYYYIGQAETRDTISIQGMGKVTAIPDIATFTVGIQTEKYTVAAAQKENTDKMNEIIKALKEMGVEEEDIKTSQYNIYPQYNWNEGQRTLRGYQVTQSVTIKVRDLDKVGDIFARAGELGANNVGGLQFTIDDPEEYKQEARLKALENAKEKAEALADAADVKLGKVVGFSESSGGTPYPSYRSYDLGLGAGMAEEAVAPDIEAGSTEIIIYVNVNYQVL